MLKNQDYKVFLVVCIKSLIFAIDINPNQRKKGQKVKRW